MVSDRTSHNSSIPAPCIVDSGTIVNKRDIKRLLGDVGAVRYHYSHGDHCISEGEGYVIDVFADPNASTLVTNHSLYINVCSFDYLELSRTLLSPPAPPASESIVAPRYEAHFDLVQENMRLRLVPLSNPLKVRCSRTINSVALDAVVADMLSSSFDFSDDDDNFFV